MARSRPFPWGQVPKIIAATATLVATVTGLVVALRPPRPAATVAPSTAIVIATATVVTPRAPGESLGPDAPPPAPDPEDPDPAPELDGIDPTPSPWPTHDGLHPWCHLLGEGETHRRCWTDAPECRSSAAWYRSEYGVPVGRCADRSGD